MTPHAQSLEITPAVQGEVAVLTLAGSIDSLTAEDLLEALQHQLREGRVRLVSDLSQVSYTSSAGLRALLSATKEARSRGGDLRLAGVPERIYKVLDLSGFTSILHLYPDVEAAVESYPR